MRLDIFGCRTEDLEINVGNHYIGNKIVIGLNRNTVDSSCECAAYHGFGVT